MNEKIPVKNTGIMAIYVAGQMIPAGETRHFDLDQVPAEFRPAPVVEAVDEIPPDPMADLIEFNVKAIAEAIPGLTDVELVRLAELEQQTGDHARKTVLEAIAAEQLKRAEAAQK